MRLPTPKEFNYSECLAFLNRSSIECLFYTGNSQIQKAMRVEEETVLFRVQPHDGSGLKLDFLNGQPNEHTTQAVASYVRDWLDLERDLSPFYEMAGGDPLLKRLVKRHFGLRLIGIPDLFEALAWSVIGQQINLNFAYTLKKRLVERFGEKVTGDGRNFWLFPSPETVAGLSPETLLQMQFSRNKAEYLVGIARRIASGELSKEIILNEGNDLNAMRVKLLEIRGVGRWTADYVLMKCFRLPSAFPIGDVGLHNALKIQLGLPQKPSLKEIEKIAAGWRGWEAYATFYLWRSLI